MKKHVPLYTLAHSRAGDKFNTALISVLPYELKYKELLRNVLTPEYVEEHFRGIIKGRVERHETPYGFIFILHAALEGGVVAGLRRDKHGKSLSGYMLEISIPLSPELQIN
jgi:hypothetical protein